MRTIDFIPAWYRDRQAERRGARWRTAGLFAALALAAAWTIDGAARTHAAESAQADLKASADAQSALLARLAQLEAERSEQARRALILDAVSGEIPMHELLAEVSHLLPESLTLQTLRVHRSPHWATQAPPGAAPAAASIPAVPAMLELTGWAKSGADVSAFVGRLDSGPLCSDVTLRYELPTVIAGVSMQEFQVQCTMPQFE
jgi:Tfp pilus assembly protein PilN